MNNKLDVNSLRNPEEVQAYLNSLEKEVGQVNCQEGEPLTEEELLYLVQHGTLPEFSLQEPLRKAS